MHRLYHCPEWHGIRRESTALSGTKSNGGFKMLSESGSQKARASKGGVEMAKRYCDALSESQWNKGHFSMTEWESEKHKNWGLPAEGFKDHVATDGSGKWGARGWAVVQLDYEEEMGPLHGM